MILCRECGNSAPSSDGFCSSCGALLDWSGERVETKVLPAVQGAAAKPSAAAQDGSGAGDAGRSRGAGVDVGAGASARVDVGAGLNARTWAAQPEPSTTPEFGPVAPRPPAPSPNPHSPGLTAAIGAAGRDTPPPPGWTPAAEARRADPVPIASEPEYTGPYCQGCGVRNPADRRFCRSCGAMLHVAAAPPPVRRGWWRRLIDRVTGRRRQSSQYAAGQRPTGFRDHHGGSAASPGKRGLRLPRHIKLGRLAPVLIVAGLAGVGLGPARTWVTTEANTLLGRAKARVNQHYVNVTPVGAAAVSTKDHGAPLAIDGLNTTYWASAQHPDGVGESLTISFATPVDIDQIGVLSGADAQNFRAFARPRDLVVTAAGAPPATLNLDDSAEFQSRAAVLRHVTTVTITVKDAYPGQSRHDLAIRDLEFFVKSG